MADCHHIKKLKNCNWLTDCNEISQDDTNYSSASYRPLKFRTLKIQDQGGGSCHVENKKSPYLGLGLTDHHEIWDGDTHFCCEPYSS